MVSTTLAASSVRRDNEGMKQADLGLELTSRKTRKGKFLDEMERVVPWAQLLALIEPHAPRKERGRLSVALSETIIVARRSGRAAA